MISSDSVAKGKPAPDVFLKAAELLGAAPQRCIVFEDSYHGVQAGLAAGMKVFAVPSTRGNGIERLATRTFSSLAEVTLEDISAELGQ
jgi:beta-phosphoglucomutase-like phosphatase (HAD superfamily)